MTRSQLWYFRLTIHDSQGEAWTRQQRTTSCKKRRLFDKSSQTLSADSSITFSTVIKVQIRPHNVCLRKNITVQQDVGGRHDVRTSSPLLWSTYR